MLTVSIDDIGVAIHLNTEKETIHLKQKKEGKTILQNKKIKSKTLSV